MHPFEEATREHALPKWENKLKKRKTEGRENEKSTGEAENPPNE